MTRKWSANNGLHFLAEGLFQSLSRSDLHDLEATNRLGCHFHHRLRPVHACGQKATVVLECSSRVFMSRPAVPEALEHAAAACVLRWTWEALVVALISLSCPLEPLHFLSTLYRFSHHPIKCVKGPGSPYPALFGWNCPWRCTDGSLTLQGKDFHSFPSWLREVMGPGPPNFTSKP